MSTTTTTGRTWRQIARGIIAPVIAANQGKTRKEQRKALRLAYPRYAASKTGHAYKVWCEECAFALRERSRRSYVRHQVKRPEDIMQIMRPWAAERGLVEITAVLDIDD